MRRSTPYLVVCAFAALLVAGRFVTEPAPAANQHSPIPIANTDTPRASELARRSGWGSSPFERGSPVALAMAAPAATPKKSASPIYGRSGRAVDLGGANVAQFIEKRMVAARGGDTKAAYEVYQAESVCANNDDPVAEFQQAAEREQFLLEREGLKKLCANVSPAQVQERLAFLEVAARSQNASAQIDFFMEGPYGKAQDLSTSGDDPIVKKWKEDSITYLTGAGEHGDPFALGLLSTAYDAGEVVERNLKMSLAYSVAEAAARKVNLTQDQLRTRFADQMSAADFADGLQIGAKLAQNCCQN